MITVGIAGVRHPHIDAVFAEAGARDDLQVIGVADADAAARTSYAQRYDVPAYAHHRELLEDRRPDVVAIGDVFAARGAIVADLLDAGVHVLADKPLATTLDDLDRIEAAARRSEATLSMMLEKRFYPPTLALLPLLPELGTITLIASSGPHKLKRPSRPDWMFRRAYYGGILTDLGVHDLDLALHLSGARRGEISGYAGNLGNTDRPEFEDHGVAVLRFDGGPIVTVEAHWMSPEAAPYHGDYTMRITGTKGTAELEWKDNRLTIATHDRPPYDAALPAGLRPAQDFFDALAGGRAPVVTAADAFAATRLALLAQAAADDGNPRRFALHSV